MAKSRTEYLSGKGMYVRMQNLDKFGKWSLQLYLDQKSLSTWAKLKEEGILNSSKRDDQGEFVRLSRPAMKTFRGIETQMSPPVVIDKDGNTIQDWIGNGSDIEAKITVYQFTKQFGGGQGSAIRLEGIKVLNLVPYAPAESGTPAEQKQVEGMQERPQPW